MGITIQEAYELLHPRGVELVAITETGRNKVIETVCVQELLNSIIWIKGNELLLSTLNTIYDQPEAQINLIKQLHALKVTALGIHPGFRPHFPLQSKVIDVARELNFPIFVFPQRLEYASIIYTLLEKIINRQNTLLKQALQINEQLTRIVLHDGEPRNVIRILEKMLKHPIIYLSKEDETLGQLPALNGISLVDIISRSTPVFLPLKDSERRAAPHLYVTEHPEATILLSPVKMAGECFGYLIALYHNCQPDDLDRITMSYAARAISFHMLKDKNVYEKGARIRQEIFKNILTGSITEHELQVREGELQLSVPRRGIVIVIKVDSGSNTTNSLEYVARHIETIIPREDFITTLKKRIVMIIREEAEGSTTESIARARKLITSLKERVSQKYPGFIFAAGIGPVYKRLAEISLSYQEAIAALEIGERLFTPGFVNDYRQVALTCRLTEENGQGSFLTVAELLLKDLIDYDRKNHTDLLSTLKIYLDHNCNLKKTAPALFLHPNTIKYRINKIREILGPDCLTNARLRLNIHIATTILAMSKRDKYR
ncbi:PucR family transcriptional regulator ligand-binding domain-containing protein [Moorella naiadis]|uniref:PucR family transcriptional regulator n=1 Tax=Moorella naiadis (nom. illeg.) TaxID=3093670 RepID=UPI003D9CBCE0